MEHFLARLFHIKMENGTLRDYPANCAPEGTLPSMEELELGLGTPGYISLLFFSSLTAFILWVEFTLTMWHHWWNSSKAYFRNVFQIHSVYLIVSLLTLVAIVLPESTDFAWAFYKVRKENKVFGKTVVYI